MSHGKKADLVALLLYIIVIACMDRRRGFLTAARICRAYANMMREVGTQAHIQAIRAENWARELVTP